MRENISKKILTMLAGVVLVLPFQARAQGLSVPVTTDSYATSAGAPAKPPEFDVSSVKENKSGSNNMEWRSTPDGFSAMNLSLKNLIANAYGIKQDLIFGGPGWLDSTGFDIDAKVAGEDMAALKALTRQQRSAMVKPLLADRFHLKVHVETKVLPVYDLVIAKSGSKLQVSSAPAFDSEAAKVPGVKAAGTMMMGDGRLSGVGLDMTSLADQLSYAVHRTVIDKTGLKGKYDFALKWAPEDEHGGEKADNAAPDSGPSLFSTLEEQLGLKLQPTKGPVDTLVIDHVEKPTEN